MTTRTKKNLPSRVRWAIRDTEVAAGAKANVCPECGVGESFIHSDADGSIEELCDLCTSFAPVGDPVPSRRERWEDLPPAVRVMRRSERCVYRAVRELGLDLATNPASPVMPGDVVEWLTAWYARQEPDPLKRKDAPRSTVGHALCRLSRAGLVRRGVRGWVVCETTSVKGGA